MLTSAERDIIVFCARKYAVAELYLFGSVLQDADAEDIDLAVRGIAPELFFKFLGELLRRLSRPVDLVDLTQRSLFNDLVEKRAVKIYG